MKCGFEDKQASAITRAKVTYASVRFESPSCICEMRTYANLNWNNESKKWEIEEGITIDKLPRESRDIFDKTSKLQFFQS